jgi:hypothetical protein
MAGTAVLEIPSENPEQPEAIQPKKNPLTASVRFKDQAEADRFFAVYNKRNAKGRSKTVSDFIRQMFLYCETNPYGDFPTK